MNLFTKLFSLLFCIFLVQPLLANSEEEMSPIPEEAIIIITYDDAYMYVGIGGEAKPRFTIRNVVGHPKSKTDMLGSPISSLYGDEALKQQGKLIMSSPVENGIITNMPDFKGMLQHVFYNKLKVAPEDHAVAISDKIMGTKMEREKIVQLLFETFNVPTMIMHSNEYYSLIGSGRTTGLVVELSEGLTTAAPFYEGYSLPHGVRTNQFGGADCVAYFIRIMMERGYDFNSAKGREEARALYQKHAYIALDYAAEMAKAETSSELKVLHENSNGAIYEFDAERFRSAEILFNPAFSGLADVGLHTLVHEAIMNCEVGRRGDLYNNIIIAGSNSFQVGLVDRLTKELKLLVPDADISIQADISRTYLSWQGASKLVELREDSGLWITKEEYDEAGPGIVHRKM